MPGSNCCAGSPGIRPSSWRWPWARSGSEPRRIPALREDLGRSGAAVRSRHARSDLDAVFLAVPGDAVGRGGAGAGRARPEGVRSLRRVPADATPSSGKRWYPHSPAVDLPLAYGLTERYRAELPDAQLIACAGCYPTAAVLALQPLVAAGLLAARHHHRREVRRVRRRQDADRAHALLGDATAASPPTACSAIGTAPRSSRSSGVPVTFVPHLVPLDRGILETIYARLTPGVDEAAVAAALQAAYADVAVRAPDRQPTCPRSSTSRTPTSATSAGGSSGPAASWSWCRASTTW